MSVAISWAKKVQLAKYVILVGFPKSSHILLFTYIIHRKTIVVLSTFPQMISKQLLKWALN